MQRDTILNKNNKHYTKSISIIKKVTRSQYRIKNNKKSRKQELVSDEIWNFKWRIWDVKRQKIQSYFEKSNILDI